MTNKKQDENNGIHIMNIMNAVPCPRHSADISDACWNVLSPHGLLKAICNKRAISAGANGKITPYKKPDRTAPTKKEFTR